jgi:hypothetical protein
MTDQRHPVVIDLVATYSLRAACDLVELSRERLRLAIAQGTLTATRDPDGWRVTGVDLAAWVDARKTALPAVPVGFLAPSQVARRAAVRPRTVYRVIASGDLPARWDGQRWLVREDDATVWLRGRHPGP